MFKKVLIGAGLLIALIAVASSISGDGDNSGRGIDGGGAQDSEDVVEAPIPGEATLSFGNEEVTTRVKGVTMRNEALPGNEFTKADAGKAYMAFAVEVENAGSEDHDLSSIVYRLKMPTGEIVDYLSGSGFPADEGFSGVTLPPGAKKAGQVTWEVPTPSPGDTYVLLWKPSPFDKAQAQFTYKP